MILHAPFNVLIADDHPPILAGIEATLRNLPSLKIIGSASNSTEIAELLSQHPCDLLITDFVMPNGKYNDGFNMLTHICTHYPDLSVIVFTALDSAALTAKLIKIGVKAIVSKTDDVGHLISAIYTVRSGAQFLSPSIARTRPDSSGRRKEPPLTKSEAEVLRLYVSGLSVTEIAERLHRTKQTISAQKIKGMSKLGVERDADLYRIIYQSPRGVADILDM